MPLCKYGDPTCPCQDGDMCHYEGPNPWPPREIECLKCHCGVFSFVLFSRKAQTWRIVCEGCGAASQLLSNGQVRMLD